ncbi:MAG: HNH endonuclease, partial [Candidatus Thorarchaeota archaeon]
MEMNESKRRFKRINGKVIQNSHYIWFKNTGYWPVDNEVIHHIDGNKS